jgi:hypothetical protein
MEPGQSAWLWLFLPIGYLFTVAVETPVLLVGLSPRHSWRTRLAAGFWLTACTYPVVVLVLPTLMWPMLPRWTYLTVAETFAPAAECLLFYLAFGREAGGPRRATVRDCAAIVAANLLSFGPAELWRWLRA